MATLKELRDSRLEKLKKLQELGVNPYPAKSEKNINNNEIHTDFDKHMGKDVIVAGRAVAIRTHGKLAFIDLKDPSGKVQLYIKEENISDANYANSDLNFADIELLDNGDFVEGYGKVTKTERGEVSVEVNKIRLLTKSLRPMPSAWDGLKDKETRLRRRYLDLNINEEISERFIRKSKFWKANREFLEKNGFMEVEVPVLEHVTGGADANPFITHHNDLDQDLYMRISTELAQKRLIGGGYNKVFTLAPNFRNEGLSDEHLQEYYQIEWYWAYANYKDNMTLVRDMIRFVAQEVYGKTEFTTRGHTFDLANDWTEVDYSEIIKEKFGVNIFTATEEELLAKVKEQGIKLPGEINRNRLIDNLWKAIRKTISGPAFLVNEPKFMSPLAKSKPENPELTERFHIILGGSELGNGYSELNDPIDQLERFMEQEKAREAGDDEAQMLDIDFVEMLEYGMPPCSGYAHSERLFWFLEDVPSREGVLFPLLRHEVDDVTKTIYPELYSPKAKVIDPAGNERKQDFSQKIVIVVNKDLEKWQIMNSVGHVSAYLGNKLRENFGTGDNFVTKDSQNHPRNSQYPIIILGANSNEQLHNFMEKVRESKLEFHGFIKEMIETTNDNEITEILKNKDDKDIEYLAIGVFGDNEKIDALTKKFSLLK